MRENVDLASEMLNLIEIGNQLEPSHPIGVKDFQPISVGNIALVTIAGAGQQIFRMIVPDSSDLLVTFIEVDSFLIPTDVTAIFNGTKANIGMPARYPEPAGGTVLYMQVNGNPRGATNSPFNVLANKPCMFPFNNNDNFQILMSSQAIAVPASSTPPTTITVATSIDGYFISRGKGRRFSKVQTLPAVSL